MNEYTGAPDDQELPALALYLATLADAANVRRLEKRHWRSVAERLRRESGA